MFRILILTGFFVMAFSPQASGQSAPKLVLQTSPNATEIELKDSVVLGADGSLTATPADASVCQATNTCDGVIVAVTEFGFAGTQSRSLSVDEGDTVELTWRSSGATSCQPISTFPPWRDKSFVSRDSRDATLEQRTISTSDLASETPYELKLQCANGSVESVLGASSTLELTVNTVVPPSPTSCEGRDPITGWTRLTTGSLSCLVGDSTADCRSWNPDLWSNSFLGSSGISKKILTNVSDERQYVAIRFGTDGMSSSASGGFDFERAAGFITKPAVRMTISKCPGDFNTDQATGCFFSGNLFNASWRGPDAVGSTSCILESDAVYYLNILATPSDDTVGPNNIAPDSRCNQDCGLLITPY